MGGKDSDSKSVNRKCSISQLDPFIDKTDVIRFVIAKIHEREKYQIS